jgi:hypothetical protein
METRQRIQTEARRDDEEVMTMSRSRLVLTGVLAASCLPFLTSALAQGTPAPLIIDNPKDFHRYALYCPKPEYPINLRDRRLAGSGKFLLHIRPDGTFSQWKLSAVQATLSLMTSPRVLLLNGGFGLGQLPQRFQLRSKRRAGLQAGHSGDELARRVPVYLVRRLRTNADTTSSLLQNP